VSRKTTPKKVLASAEDASVLVNETFSKADKLIERATRGYGPKTRWLLQARIVSRLFQNHYGLSLFAADRAINKAEAAND